MIWIISNEQFLDEDDAHQTKMQDSSAEQYNEKASCPQRKIIFLHDQEASISGDSLS